MKRLALILGLLASPLAAESLTVPGRWSEEKANQWYDAQPYFKKNRIAAYNWGLVAQYCCFNGRWTGEQPSWLFRTAGFQPGVPPHGRLEARHPRQAGSLSSVSARML